MQLRNQGKRKVPTSKPRSRDVIGESLGSNARGDHRVNTLHVHALESLFDTSPAIGAARSVLNGQLLSGGIAIRRGGEDVKLKPTFENFFNEVWIKFASRAIDSILKFGYCVWVYEEDVDSVTSVRAASKQKDTDYQLNRMPVVPPTEAYEVGYMATGRLGYLRKYSVFSTAPGSATVPDKEARIMVRDEPDMAGNCTSPTGQIFELASFVGALTELALTAETTNARPRIWTQTKKEVKSNGLDPSTLFFDTESRGVQASQDAEDSAKSANALAMQSELCKIINRLQTANEPAQTTATGQLRSHYAPPPVPPSLFTLPRDQESASSSGQMPVSRGDLEHLTRLSIEQTGAAFGVPADLMFQSRFAGKSTAQVQLLNTTISEISKTISRILTLAWHDLYGESDGDSMCTLELRIAPMSATEEVTSLFAAGLIPRDIAMRNVLKAIGTAPDEIERAVKEAQKEEKSESQDSEQTESRPPGESSETAQQKRPRSNSTESSSDDDGFESESVKSKKR